MESIKVSVVLSTYMGERFIQRSIESILQNDYGEFELIIVDQSPTDSVERLILNSSSSDPRLKYVHIEKAGLSHARNVGTDLSSGNLILFTDDDVVVSSGWIEAYVNCYTELLSLGIRPGVMGGPVEGIWEEPRPSWWPEEYGFLICEFDMGNERKEYEQGWLPFGANIAFPKDVLQEVAGFNETMGTGPDRKRGINLLSGEDTLCVMKVRDKGYPLYYEPTARIHHFMTKERLTKEYYLQRIFWEGCNRVNVSFMLYPVTRTDAAKVAYHSISDLLRVCRQFVVGRLASAARDKKKDMLELGRMRLAMGQLYWLWKWYVAGIGKPKENSL